MIHDEFVVPKTSLKRYLNVIFLPLKYSSLKHLWYLTSLGKINNKIVRNKITGNIVRKKLVQKSYPIKDKEAYIVATTEIECSHGLPRDTNTISY